MLLKYVKNTVEVKSTFNRDVVVDEYLTQKYSNYYAFYPSGKSMKMVVELIENGILPYLYSVPCDNDDYLKNIYDMYNSLLFNALKNQDKKSR